MSTDPTPTNEKQLIEALEKDPTDWETRKKLAHLLYDRGSFQEAADLVWATDEIPSIDIELAFAARVLAKASPRKAIRLLTAVLEHNRGKAVQNLGLANALLHHGMVLQAARFYGAAMEVDPTLGNPDLEHFILWTDDEESLWGDFKGRSPKLGELPWMRRDPKEAMKLTSRISHHTTPVKVTSLQPVLGEELRNELYQQTPKKSAEPSPPPAVTIPLDRVDPKYRRFDPELGAPGEPEMPEKKAATPEPSAAIPEKTAPEKTAPETPPKPSILLPKFPPPTIKPAGNAPEPAKPSAMDESPGPKKLQLATPSPTSRPKPTLPPLKKPDAPA